MRKLTVPYPPKSSVTKPKNRTLTPNLTRRTHRKSRNGCFQCKNRRIKCDEADPACQNCLAKALVCTYPEISVSIGEQCQTPAFTTRASARGCLLREPERPFSWQDMQAWQHFLIFCPPSLPLGNHEVWVRYVPQLAHQKPFLMQALLALGASHLSRLTHNAEQERQALQHRGRAITGFRDLFKRSSAWSTPDLDGAIATSYALAFQASHMEDGIDDYLAFVNGCGLLTQHVRSHNVSSGFNLATGRASAKYGADLAMILAEEDDLSLIHEAAEAFDELKPYVIDPAELDFFVAVRDILESFEKGACVGVLTGMEMYGVWHHLAGAYLKVFLRSDNSMSQLLLVYFLTVQVIFRGLLPWQWWADIVILEPPGQPFIELLQWITAFEQTMPEYLQPLLCWPRLVLQKFNDEVKPTCDVSSIILDQASKIRCVRNMHIDAHIVVGDILRNCADLTTWFESILDLKIKTTAVHSRDNKTSCTYPSLATTDSASSTGSGASQRVFETIASTGSPHQIHEQLDKCIQRSYDDFDFISLELADDFFDLMPDAPG
ncbi:hypothetical protein H2198_007041 [Neophaeococcomyces mojaviensis]|uniref:Uncharacterized protein n=1 Tax=Neophaeococcomyces mojaviensis TaxID=3383035 RepID=A0ACC3A185_9EURO|nr:hypothetical protein H2198_007041 [Knufia sp. JES_112]